MDFQAEALWFEAHEDQAAYAIVNERVLSPDFKYHVGVRGKLGYTFSDGCYQVALQYLHYHARTRSSDKGPLTPLWGCDSDVLDTSVDSMWRLHLGILDGLFGRNWDVSSCVRLFPFVGLSYAEVRHKSDIDYVGTRFFSMKNKFWGVGPKFGLEGLWEFGCGFGLYSRASLGLLFGEFYIHQDEREACDELKSFDEFYDTRPFFDLALGLNYNFCLWGANFFARASGEFHLYPGQNRLSRCIVDSYRRNKGDLTLHGGSFGLGLSF